MSHRAFGARLLFGAMLAVFLAVSADCSGGTQSKAPATAGSGGGVPTISGPVADAPGKLLYLTADGFWTLQLSTGLVAKLVGFPANTFPSTPAASPDGALVAYGLYQHRKDSPTASGVDLYVMSVDGTNQRPVLTHDESGVSFDEPAWAPDNRTLYFTRRNLRGEGRIERARLDGTERTVIVENAFSPTLSADGQWLAYATIDPKDGTGGLWVARPDGKDARRLLRTAPSEAMATPRFAPDGRRIAFVAVGTPSQHSPGRSSRLPIAPLRSWFRPRIAYAHGIPWDLWLVNTDGTGLRRLTNLGEDYPTPAWSPDGRYLALAGELGLYLLRSDGTNLRRIAVESAAGLTWLRR